MLCALSYPWLDEGGVTIERHYLLCVLWLGSRLCFCCCCCWPWRCWWSQLCADVPKQDMKFTRHACCSSVLSLSVCTSCQDYTLNRWSVWSQIMCDWFAQTIINRFQCCPIAWHLFLGPFCSFSVIFSNWKELHVSAFLCSLNTKNVFFMPLLRYIKMHNLMAWCLQWIMSKMVLMVKPSKTLSYSNALFFN